MELQVIKAGKMEYSKSLELQERLLLARQENRIPDTLVLVTHPPVITMGRDASPANIRASREQLSKTGIEIYKTGRGGDVTYHGPGQLVGYPIMDLKRRGRDVHSFYSSLEQVIINLLGNYDIQAKRDPLYPGVWVGNNKIAAIGIAVKKWVTMHGFALNIYPDPLHKKLIVPCGIINRGITTFQESVSWEINTDGTDTCELDTSRTDINGVSDDKIGDEIVKAFSQIFSLKPSYTEVS